LVEFYEISYLDQKDLEKALSIYVDSIPPTERQPVDLIKERVSKKKERIFVGRSNNEIIFMALLWPIRNTDFLLLDYMAVKEAHRNRGIGTEFIRNIYRLLGVENKRIILEVEDPRYGDNKKVRKRRVRFYTRNGAKKMKNVNYILPPLSGDTPTRMIIMMLSPYDENRLSGRLVRKIITRIYKEVYGRDNNDSFLNLFINDVPSSVELTREMDLCRPAI